MICTPYKIHDIRMIKSEKINGEACGNFGVEERCIQCLVGKCEGERIYGKLTLMGDDHIMDIRKIYWTCVT